MSEMKNNKKILVGIGVFVIIIVAFAIVYSVFKPKPSIGSKNITIEVVNKEKDSKKYEIQTDAEYLRQAMEEAPGLTFDGQESEFGMMVETVNGETADYNIDGSYWSFYVNGEYCNYGIDSQPVTDKDEFLIQYTTMEE